MSASVDGPGRATISYDLLGRQTMLQDYGANGATVVYSQATSTKQGSDVYLSVSTHGYGAGTGYALGGAVTVATKTYRNGNDGAAPDTLTTTLYH